MIPAGEGARGGRRCGSGVLQRKLQQLSFITGDLQQIASRAADPRELQNSGSREAAADAVGAVAAKARRPLRE